jgi:hypothetical protein
MAGVLSFTLGLEASNFLREIGLASHEVLSFTAVGEGLHKVMEKISQTIERGAGLEHLSKRTGESIADLYELQKGFAAVGVEGEAVAPMLFAMQRALGGVNEFGERTQNIFGRLGLSVGQLKREGGAQAFQEITTALGKLNQSDATKAASSIFGRMGAGNALQISRSAAEFADAMAKAAPMAYVFDRVAKTFAEIERGIAKIKNTFEAVWLGIAQYAAGPIKAIIDKLGEIDLSKIGQRIGQMVGLLAESFGNGKWADLLVLSFQVAFEKAGVYVMKFALGLGAAIMTVLPAAIEAAFKMVGQTGSRGKHLFSEIQVLHDTERVEELERLRGEGKNRLGGKWGPKDDEELADAKKFQLEHMQRGAAEQSQIQSSDGLVMAEVMKSMAGALPRAMEEAHKAWASVQFPESQSEAGLSAALDDFRKRWEKSFPPSESRGRGNNSGGLFENLSLHNTEGNLFEKMGFIMGGPGGPAGYQQETARNTGKTVDLLSQLLNQLGNLPSGPTEQQIHAYP